MQLICVLISLTLFYLIFTRTWFFQAGLFGTMITKFRSFVIVFVLNLIFLITVRFWRLVLVIIICLISSIPSFKAKPSLRYGTCELTTLFTSYTVYVTFHLSIKLTSTVTPIYYVSVIRACFKLCQYNLYNASQEDIRLALQNTTK